MLALGACCIVCLSDGRADQPGGATRPAFSAEDLKPVALLGDPSFRHAGTITKMVVLSDGQRVLTCGHDGAARLWDLKTGNQLQCYAHQNTDVWDIAVLPGEEQFLTAGNEKAVVLWDLKTGKRLETFPHGNIVFRVGVDASGQRFAAGDYDGRCIVWDLRSKKQLANLRVGDPVYTVMFDRDGTGVVSGSGDSTIRLWKIADAAEAAVLKKKDKKDKKPDAQADPNNSGAIYTLSPSKDKTQVLVCCADRGPWMMDAQTGREIWRTNDVPFAYCGAWAPDGRTVASLSGEGGLWVLNAADGSKLWKVDLPGLTHYGVDFSRDGKEVLCGSMRLLCRFEARTGKRVFPPPDAQLQQDGVNTLLVMPNSDLVLEAGSADGIRVWDRRSRLVRHVWLPGQEVRDMALSADGNTLLAAIGETAAVLDARGGKTIRELRHDGKNNKVHHVALTHNGELAITIAYSENFTVWRVATGKREIETAGADYGLVRGMAVSPDDMELATGSEEGIHMWSLVDGKLSRQLSEIKKPQGCAFLPGEPPVLVGWTEDGLFGWGVPVEAAPLTEDDAKTLIAQLGSANYAKREAATKRLIAAGRSILPLLRTTKAGNLEASERLRAVQEGILGARYRLSSSLKVDAKMRPCFGVHPDGHHWAGVQGSPAERQIMLGDIRDGQFKVLRCIPSPHAPETVVFDQTGALLAGNCNGTISIYAARQGTQ